MPATPLRQIDPLPDCALARQFAVLDRAARMLGRGFVPEGMASPGTLTGPFRAKLLGNGLRELDLMLNRLADAMIGGDAVPTPDSGWPTQRNTANKLRGLLGERDHARLRALWRTRGCLLHCNGVVRSGDGAGESHLTLGWSEGAGRDDLKRIAVGERIEISAEALRETRDFYLELAGKLRSLASNSAPSA